LTASLFFTDTFLEGSGHFFCANPLGSLSARASKSAAGPVATTLAIERR
jgi:hypothetical protein